MSQVNVTRAWKDEEYRNGLSDAERAALPENPAGVLGRTGAELEGVQGGALVGVNNWYLFPYLRAQPQTPGTSLFIF